METTRGWFALKNVDQASSSRYLENWHYLTPQQMGLKTDNTSSILDADTLEPVH